MSLRNKSMSKFSESSEAPKWHSNFMISRPYARSYVIEVIKPKRNQWYHGWRNKLPNLFIRAVRIGLFLGATFMALYQTVLALDDYVNQMSVSKIVPHQRSSMSRPNVVVCVNVYEMFLKNTYRRLTPERLRMGATLGLDYGTLFYNKRIQIFNISDDKYPFVRWEQILHHYSLKFSNCSDVFGVCNDLVSSWAGNAYNCCDNARKWNSPESVCHSVFNTRPQLLTGKANAAMYELLFPMSSHDATYSIFFEHPGERSNMRDQPVATVKAGLEMNIEIQMGQYSQLNTTDRKCSDQNKLVMPLCESRVRRQFVSQLCYCDDSEPIWAFDVSQWKNKDMDPGDKGNRSRPCRLLEDWLCLGEHVLEYNELTSKTVAQCYRSKCHSTKYVEKTMQSTLAPYFIDYSSNHRKDHNYSTLYLFYGTMTVTDVSEVYCSTWMSILSDLGGVWGLWLGWSLFQAANLLLSIMGNGVKG